MELYWIAMATLLLSRTNRCESATLTIVPDSLSITNTTVSAVSVTVKCSPTATFDSLISLAISRNLTSNPNVAIQMATVTTKNPVAHMVTTIPGASASGSLAENFVQVTMTQVSCNDAGTYRCTASYFVVDSSMPETSMDDKNFTVQVLPGQITLTAMPEYIYYELNTTLEMTCNGPVGSTTSGTQISWAWEYRDYQSFIWNSYMPESDITPPSPPLTDNKCQNNQVSVLTRRITLDDEKRIYRCYVRRNGQIFSDLAGSYQIGTVGSTGQVSAITLNPTTLTLTNNHTYGTVVITCQPPADANIKSLLVLGIKRSTSSIVNQNVGLYEKADNVLTVNPIINGATITGGGTSNSITVAMSQVSCMDAGVYTCDVTFIDPQNIVRSLFSSDNLTVNASPGDITLTPDPRLDIYPNGSSLTLTCNGLIGSEEVQWVWEYKDLGAGWSTYIPQSENDISIDPPSSILNSCQKNQESRLSRVITTEDDGRTYRCYVRRGSFNFEQYAAEYIIQNVGSQGPTSAPNTSKGSEGKPSSPNLSTGSINPGTTTGCKISASRARASIHLDFLPTCPVLFAVWGHCMLSMLWT